MRTTNRMESEITVGSKVNWPPWEGCYTVKSVKKDIRGLPVYDLVSPSKETIPNIARHLITGPCPEKSKTGGRRKSNSKKQRERKKARKTRRQSA